MKHSPIPFNPVNAPLARLILSAIRDAQDCEGPYWLSLLALELLEDSQPACLIVDVINEIVVNHTCEKPSRCFSRSVAVDGYARLASLYDLNEQEAAIVRPIFVFAQMVREMVSPHVAGSKGAVNEDEDSY